MHVYIDQNYPSLSFFCKGSFTNSNMFLVAMLWSSLRKLNGRNHYMVSNYGLSVAQMITYIFRFFFRSSFLFRMISMSTTVAANSVEGTDNPSGTHEFSPVFVWHSFCSIFSFLCSALSTIVCLFCSLSFVQYIVCPSLTI
jgi:hypothetical protein